MLQNSLLYPCNNNYRSRISLDGLWKFCFDPDSVGEQEGWPRTGLADAVSMPVPASFADLFTTEEERDYCGDFWYETEFYRPCDVQDRRLILRFGSIAHRAVVYCNGQKVAEHEGGFLPVICDVTEEAKKEGPNRLVVKVNNELSEETLPCGAVKRLRSGRKLAKPYFDFFHYAGIQRSVYLLLLPGQGIVDYSTAYELEGENARVKYGVECAGEGRVRVSLLTETGETAALSEGMQGTLHVEKARLWEVRNAYLYTLKIEFFQEGKKVDEYQDQVGIRTIDVAEERIKVNGRPVYLKGFGKHEDFEVIGRGFHWAVAKRDFECMKWTGANCFRTSHYPYAEEWYRLADQEGFLVIDEVPAVGMKRSIMNFVEAGTGNYTAFFESPSVSVLKENHKKQIREMILRDKNRPCVLAFSLFNEPETTSEASEKYFTDIFQYARELDPQRRPLTGALEKDSSPQDCKCFPLLDFICLNRYYGWYIHGGPELEEAVEEFREEMEAWQKKNLQVPLVFTEFGADTLASEHKLPGVMWTQEYQNRYMETSFAVMDEYSFVQGELAWNFADFQTQEGIMRVNGNKKGIFTRNRQPKDVAYVLKRRWEQAGKESL